MANSVKISSIGALAVQADPDATNQQVVDHVIEHWRIKVAQVTPDAPDLIVVPECCDVPAGFPMDNRDYYRHRKNQVRDFFTEVAKDNRCYVAYSAAREMPDGSWRNSTTIIDRNGDIAGIYNKNHVVIEETTEAGILCGKDAPIIECDFGRVACAICFDLNFEELRSKYAAARPDLIIFCSAYHGGLAQAMWAYCCRAHFVGAIGNGPCQIRNPQGDVIASSTNYHDFITATVNLDCRLAHLDYNQERLAKLKAKYGPRVEIHDPGYLGSVLISSEDPDVAVEQMIAEFEIELLDDYMSRAMAHRNAPEHMED